MKLKVWEDEKGYKRFSLDDVGIKNVTGLNLHMYVGHLPVVELTLLPASVEVEVDAKVRLIIDGNKYRLESIIKE